MIACGAIVGAAVGCSRHVDTEWTPATEADRIYVEQQADKWARVMSTVADGEMRQVNLSEGAKAALDAGRREQAREWATELLTIADAHPGDWDYGTAIHDSHEILGRLALADGDREGAKEHLLAAGKTPGAPWLNSFGPNMTLARNLLAAGERDVVLAYFDECRSFWRFDRGQLGAWRRAAANGDVPDFGANLQY